MLSISDLQKGGDSEDLETKERRLRELNEKLENHQREIVSKAQELIQENKEFLRNPKLGEFKENSFTDAKTLADGHRDSD